MLTLEEWRRRRSEWFVDAIVDFAPHEGNGWGKIVDELLVTVEAALLDRPDRRLRIGQIKEKLGSLRIYFRILPDDRGLRRTLQDAVEKALTRSAMTCMICGRNGNASEAPGCMMGFDKEPCPSNHPLAEEDG